MRVLLYVDADVSRPGGVETHVRELATALSARGHDVEVFGRASTALPITVVDRLDLERYDVVHHHGGAWPRGARPKRYVRTLHYSTAGRMAAYLRILRMRTLVNPGNWRALREEHACVRRRGRFIAVSARVRDEYARFHGLDPAAARVVPNGVAFAAPVRGRDALRAAWGVADAPVLLTIGRPDFVKGYDLLARAWERAAKPPGSLWVTVGGLARERGPGRLVTGPLPHAEVIDWIHASDLGALPSYYEGCSVALLEMLAGRLYSLAHDVGNAVEVIRPGENGEIVPQEVASWSAALSRTLARPPRPAGPGLPEGYRWADVAERVEEVYGAPSGDG